jgi:hypothetical protein
MRVPIRHCVGPTSELIEESDPTDPTAPRVTVVSLAERYRRLASLRMAMEVGASFFRQPMVPGVAALVEADPETGRYTYLTGEVWPVAAMLEDARRRDAPLGPRAAAELGWMAGLALAEAAEAAEASGVFCHGDVSPWRVVVSADGAVQVVGYGLAEPEALRMRHTEGEPKEDTFAYAAPERAWKRLEDVRSDLHSLALVLVEVATGAPLLSGDPVQVRDACRAGAAHKAVLTAKMPADLRAHVAKMLVTDIAARGNPGGRWTPSEVAGAWAAGFEALLEQEGPSLGELVAALARREDRAIGRTTPTRQIDHTEDVRGLPALLTAIQAEEAPAPAHTGVADRVRPLAGSRVSEGPRPRRIGQDTRTTPATVAPRTAGTSQPAPLRITPASAVRTDDQSRPARAMDDTRRPTHGDTPVRASVGDLPRRARPDEDAATQTGDLPRRAAPAAEPATPRPATPGPATTGAETPARFAPPAGAPTTPDRRPPAAEGEAPWPAPPVQAATPARLASASPPRMPPAAPPAPPPGEIPQRLTSPTSATPTPAAPIAPPQVAPTQVAPTQVAPTQVAPPQVAPPRLAEPAPQEPVARGLSPLPDRTSDQPADRPDPSRAPPGVALGDRPQRLAPPPSGAATTTPEVQSPHRVVPASEAQAASESAAADDALPRRMGPVPARVGRPPPPREDGDR